jgi:uncharacterized protein
MSDPATAVFTRRVLPGHEAAYEQLAREAAAAATRYPGHLAATVLHEDGTVDYTVLYSFSDRAALDAWLDSPSRRRFAAQVEPFSVARYESPRITGLETWFMLPHVETIKPPPRWKMWLVSLLALYPLVVIFQQWLAPIFKNWPLPARAAAFPLILLTLMTYLVMPAATRLVAAWLYPERD